ncbi:MAG TPA: lysophospholipid acyltransferase family protein [Chitinophagales bacterium]|nr:lysophospholipid acyltransferase family protein [Chitinophagales bacterium]
MWTRFLTFILNILLALIGLLPFKILRPLSKALDFFLYNILHYRRDVVNLNMIYALPFIEGEKFKEIEKNFYRHFSELILEIIKGFYISLEKLLPRIKIDDTSLELLNKLTKENRHVVLMLGHYGNWEWPLLIIQQYTTLKPFAFYAPLSFKALDQLIKNKRERFGATMLDANRAKEYNTLLKGQASIIALVGDQSPTGRTRTHDTRFLSLNTHFFNGGERLAKNLDAAVLFVHFTKTGIGKYDIHLELISENSNQEEEGIITEKYVRILEQEILQQPSNWIWSHKRWKGMIPY